MRIAVLSLLIALSGVFASGGASEDKIAVISPDGYGPVTIGMTPDEASSALGVTFATDEADWDAGCYHVWPEIGLTELAFMVIDGRIARVSIYGGPSDIRTDKGIGVGDPVEKVRAAYGDALNEQEHEYLGPEGRYLTFWDSAAGRGVRYETDPNGKVDTIHAGGDAIRYIEGCA